MLQKVKDAHCVGTGWLFHGDSHSPFSATFSILVVNYY